MMDRFRRRYGFTLLTLLLWTLLRKDLYNFNKYIKMRAGMSPVFSWIVLHSTNLYLPKRRDLCPSFEEFCSSSFDKNCGFSLKCLQIVISYAFQSNMLNTFEVDRRLQRKIHYICEIHFFFVSWQCLAHGFWKSNHLKNNIYRLFHFIYFFITNLYDRLDYTWDWPLREIPIVSCDHYKIVYYISIIVIN